MGSKRFLFIGLVAALALFGCAQYATVSQTRPRFTPVRSTVRTLAAAEDGILKGLAQAARRPLPALSEYLTCAETAADELRKNPGDEAALKAYNFAVARVFTTIQNAKLDPWNEPLRVPAAGGDYVLTHVRDPNPNHNPALYDYTPADQFDVKGTYVHERTVKEGLGAPLVAIGKEEREEGALIFRHRDEIGRVIFIAGPHRGSEMATSWIGRLGSSLIRAPRLLLTISNELRKAVIHDPTALKVARVPNSVDTLAPNNRFVRAINTIPIRPGIPYHSIMGDRGKGGNRDRTPPVSTDGIVPYWSSHLEGAQSELVVPSNHSASCIGIRQPRHESFTKVSLNRPKNTAY